MKNIDGEIYKNQLIEAIDFELIAEEFELENEKETLREAIEEELDILVESNLLEFDDPKLSEDQFGKLIFSTATKIHLNKLMNEGLIQASLDVEVGKNVYSLTEKGKEVSKKLF